MFSTSSTSTSARRSSIQGIGYSPGPSNIPPASSGIPTFRSLRSLLPFGSSKNVTTPNASFAVSSSSSPNTSKSPFSGFGSARRSLQKDRERKPSLSSDVLRPVITIERDASEEAAVRRSVSFSDLERPEPLTPRHANISAFALRTPSPGPPLSIELSTIMEADNSGVSKNPPSANPSRSSSPPVKPVTTEEDTFALDLSTAQVADQVRNAILSSDSSPNSVKQWRNADRSVVIIDADDKEIFSDSAFSLDNADPQLVALLSPNSLKNTNQTLEKGQTLLQPPGPASTRLPRSSFLPRLRPSTSPSSPATAAAVSPKPSSTKGQTPIIAIHGTDNSAPSSSNIPSQLSPPTSTPVLPSRRKLSLSRPGKLFTPDRSNSLSLTQAPAFGSEKDQPNPSATTTTTSKEPVRTLRRVVLGMTGHHQPNTPTPSPTRIITPPFGRASLDSRRAPTTTSASEIGLGRPSLEIRRANNNNGFFDSRRRPSPTTFEPRSSTASERTESGTTTTTAATTPNTESSSSSPPLEMPDEEPAFQRRSVDSAGRPSLEGPRPGSRLLERERERKTPSSADRLLVVPRLPLPLPRSRKRSMSVQERVGRANRFVSGPAHIDTNASRPGSSLSVGRPSRGGSAGAGVGEGGGGERLGPKLEWLGPRTIKAFRAAGLLEPDREKGVKERDASGGDPLERLRERSGSASAPSPLGNNSGPLSAPGRFASLRGSAEHNNNRAHSRMAYSEVGGPTSRRGSESVSAYSGLMESPTLTGSGSSGSRGERDTPRSASTAPTSLSDTFGYFGRDRERDRDRDRDKEEIRELKERHATEVAALLGALSDSQRTVRMLRDENSELRERLERFAGVLEANDELRQACADMQRECHELRRECAAGLRRVGTPVSSSSSATVLRAPGIASSWSGGSTNSSLRTPKLATSSPLATDVTPFFEEGEEEGEYNNTIIIHDDVDRPASRHRRRRFTDDDDDDDPHTPSPLDDLLPSSTSTPSAHRRLSNTSSIFPAPPANMTMLLDDEAIPSLSSNRSSADHLNSQFHFQTSSPAKPKRSHSRSSSSASAAASSPPPVAFKNLPTTGGAGHFSSKSIASISPTTTTEFSMVTGSPRSLFLRPEHEQLLGDMESLDLGAIPPIDLQSGIGRDDW